MGGCVDELFSDFKFDINSTRGNQPLDLSNFCIFGYLGRKPLRLNSYTKTVTQKPLRFFRFTTNHSKSVTQKVLHKNRYTKTVTLFSLHFSTCSFVQVFFRFIRRLQVIVSPWVYIRFWWTIQKVKHKICFWYNETKINLITHRLYQDQSLQTP